MINTAINELYQENKNNSNYAIRIFNKFIGRFVRYEGTYVNND
jgi:hypothetical protein